MRDLHIGATRHGGECDRGLHLAGQVGVVKRGGVADAAVRHQLQVAAAKGMAVAAAKVGERHAVTATHLCVHLVHLGGEAIRRQPTGHRVGVQKGAVNAFGGGAQHAVEVDGVGGHVFDLFGWFSRREYLAYIFNVYGCPLSSNSGCILRLCLN